MGKQRTTTLFELVERIDDDTKRTVKAMQIEKMRTTEGDDYFLDQPTDKPISLETMRFVASYKAAPTENPLKKIT